MVTMGLVCGQCLDQADFVTSSNGNVMVARTVAGDVLVVLHTRCEVPWADSNGCQSLFPLRRARNSQPSRWLGCKAISTSAPHARAARRAVDPREPGPEQPAPAPPRPEEPHPEPPGPDMPPLGPKEPRLPPPDPDPNRLPGPGSPVPGPMNPGWSV